MVRFWNEERFLGFFEKQEEQHLKKKKPKNRCFLLFASWHEPFFLGTAPRVLRARTARGNPQEPFCCSRSWRTALLSFDRFFERRSTIGKQKKSLWPDLNRRPFPYQGNALPTELHWLCYFVTLLLLLLKDRGSSSKRSSCFRNHFFERTSTCVFERHNGSNNVVSWTPPRKTLLLFRCFEEPLSFCFWNTPDNQQLTTDN